MMQKGQYYGGTSNHYIGYVNISTTIKDSFSDKGHPKWIYIKCYKDSI